MKILVFYYIALSRLDLVSNKVGALLSSIAKLVNMVPSFKHPKETMVDGNLHISGPLYSVFHIRWMGFGP